MAETLNYTMSKILEGKVAGRPQIVGLMEVIPLIPQDATHTTRAFAVPGDHMMLAGNPHYGTVSIKNTDTERPLIAPTNSAWVTKHQAQDHAVSKAGLIGPGGTVSYDNAACVQATQGGAIPPGQHPFQILPATLRKGITKELADRRSYNKFWPNIAAFNGQLGVRDHGGHLTYLFEHFAKELLQFIAEFELVKDQIGAIILINGQLVGIEITPSPEYWASVWEPLVRFCYGPEALLASRKLNEEGIQAAIDSRPRLEYGNARTIEDLEAALDQLRAAEKQRAESVIMNVIDTNMAFEVETRLPYRDQNAGQITYTLSSTFDKYVGQIVTDEGYTVYCSIVSKEAMSRRPARQAFKFGNYDQ